MTVQFSDDDLNEDWPKLSSWDFWNQDGKPAARLADFLAVMPGNPDRTLAENLLAFTKLPAWQAAPAKLKAEAEAYLRKVQ